MKYKVYPSRVTTTVATTITECGELEEQESSEESEEERSRGKACVSYFILQY